MFHPSKTIIFLGICAFFFLANCSKPLPAEQGKILTVTASSTAKDAKDAYNLNNLTDDTVNSWCEGKSDDGIGESFEVTFEKEVQMKKFYIKNGFGDPKLYEMNNRVRKFKIQSDKGTSEELDLPDTNSDKEITISAPLSGTKFTFTIASVYNGSKYKDTCITEFGFLPSSISDGSGAKFCGVTFKRIEIKYSGELYSYDYSYDAEIGGGSGSYKTNDVGCSNPESFIFDSVGMVSENDGNSFTIQAAAPKSGVEPICAPQNLDISLQSCDKGIEETSWGEHKCNGVKEGSTIKLVCQ